MSLLLASGTTAVSDDVYFNFVWSGPTSNISTQTSGTATSTLRFTDKGLWDHIGGTNDGAYTTPDYTDTGIPYGDYSELKITVVSGDTPSGSSVGVWLDAGNTLQFTLTFSGSEGDSSATLEVRGRKKGSSSETVIHSSIFLSAQKILP